MANVSIGGNVTDSVVVCGNDNYVIKIGDVNGGVVNIIKPSDKPKYSARAMGSRRVRKASFNNAVVSNAFCCSAALARLNLSGCH